MRPDARALPRRPDRHRAWSASSTSRPTRSPTAAADLDLDAAVAHGLAMHARRRRPGRRRRRVDAARARTGSTPTRSSARVLPVIRELAAAGVPLSASTPTARHGGRGGARGRRGGGQRRLRRPGRSATWPRSCATPAARGSSCTGAGTADRMAELARYDDVVADVRAELLQRVDAAAAAGRRPRPAGARPRPRLRQDRRPQLGAAGAPGRPRRARAAGAGRGLAQVVPRQRCSPAPTGRRARRRRPRGRHHGDHRATARRPACGACGCTRCARRWTPPSPRRDAAHDDGLPAHVQRGALPSDELHVTTASR